MKTTRVLSLILAATLLLAAVTVLSSCKKTNPDGIKIPAGSNVEVEVANKTKKVDVAQYDVVYADEFGQETFLKMIAADFADKLGAATGESYKATAEARAKGGAAGLEILIGLTEREESKDAYASIKEDGFAIQVTDNKIVIVGTNHLLTVQAMSFFIDNYLTGDGTDSVLELHKEIKADKIQMHSIVAANDEAINVIYSNLLDTNGSSEYDAGFHPHNGLDYEVDLATTLAGILSGKTGKKLNDFKKKTDAAEPVASEILLGQVERDECKAALSELRGEEYGIFVKNGKLILTAWARAGMMGGEQCLIAMLDLATIENEDGSKSIVFPEGFKLTDGVNEKWVTDFPKPEGQGIELYNTYDDADSSLQYLYMGDGVSASAFDAYCSTLKTSGYEILTENTIEDSKFATLVNNEAKTTLYVAYNAYKHADAEKHAFEEPMLRVISAPLDAVTLPDSSLLTPNPSYNFVANSTITAVKLEGGNVGTGYVMMLEDGRFIVYDGGATSVGSSTQRMWDVLTDLYTRANNKAPSSSSPIKIAAWIISHSPGNHYQVLYDFAKVFASNGLVQLEYLIGNFPSEAACYNTTGCDFSLNNYMDTLKSSFKGGFKYLKVHTGQKLYFANAEMEILCTQEDLNPHNIVTFNDSSTTLRITFSTKNGSQRYSTLWTGDAYRYQGKWMCIMYGTYLKSDMVQVSHHGGPGCEISFYEMVDPTVVWWPHTASAVVGYTNDPNATSFNKSVDYYIRYNLDSVKYIYISDIYNITLTLKPGGADYNNLYDAVGHQTITYADWSTRSKVAAIKR